MAARTPVIEPETDVVLPDGKSNVNLATEDSANRLGHYPNSQTAADGRADNESADHVDHGPGSVVKAELQAGEKVQPKREALQRWLQEFIVDEGIVNLSHEDKTSLSSGVPSSTWNIHVVPDRLKKPHDHETEEDCFTPKAFSLGLHNVVSCFDPSKLQFKFDVARAFSIDTMTDDPEKWKSLVKAIVGRTAEERKQVRDAYRNFHLHEWELSLKPGTSAPGRETHETIQNWHFALLLAVDAIFLVTCLQASMNYCACPLEIKRLIGDIDRKFEIKVFLKWDLSLIENQVPMKLLKRVIDLQNKKIPKSPTGDQLDRLIRQAVWLSYPFVPNGLERDDCFRDFRGCCCPCIFRPGEEDPLPQQSATQDQSVRLEFNEHWSQTYEKIFIPDNYHHLLQCILVVTCWLTPVAGGSSSTSNNSSSSPQGTGKSGRLKAQACNLQMHACTRRQESTKAYQRPIIIWNEERIPPATELRDAGVRIRGVATCLASPSFKTINFWTVLRSVCCFPIFLACGFASSSSSSMTRCQASLDLPKLKMYTQTKRLLRNLAVYEQLVHEDQNGHLRSYIKTMRCLIHREEDVQLLIRSGVIQSHLAGPMEVVQSWKRIDDGLIAAPLIGCWVQIYTNLHEHLKNRCKSWHAKFCIANCSTPWL